jgi:microcystin degradation protein MlrC
MNIYVAGLFAETNTFSPIPTGIDDFDVTRQDDLKDGTRQLSDMVPFIQWKKKSEARNDNFLFGLSAWAQPAGLTTTSAYENLRDEVLVSLQVSGPVDVVLLSLHGAMVACGYDDCEGDLISLIRRQIGPKVIIAVELDLHCHLTQAMIENANIIITYKEYPHVDVGARGDELFNLAIEASLGLSHPTMALFDCKMMGMYPTSSPGMRGFIDAMVETEQLDDVLSVSFAHSFPYGDVPDAGAKLLVVTNNNRPLAQQLAKKLGHLVFSLRHQIHFDSLPMEEALPKALAIIANIVNELSKPVVVADQSDNAGAGAPSDATFALRWLLDHQVSEVAIAIFYDPQVVKLAIAAGEGAKLQIRLGGKMGVTSGDPLDLSVTVSAIKKDYVHRFPQERGEPVSIPIGDIAALHCGGIDIVVSSERCQCYSPCIFDDLGLSSANKKLLVIKSTQHFYGAFAPIASDIIYMAAPGAVPPIMQQIKYERMSTDDKYPWVDNPFSDLSV